MTSLKSPVSLWCHEWRHRILKVPYLPLFLSLPSSSLPLLPFFIIRKGVEAELGVRVLGGVAAPGPAHGPSGHFVVSLKGESRPIIWCFRRRRLGAPRPRPIPSATSSSRLNYTLCFTVQHCMVVSVALSCMAKAPAFLSPTDTSRHERLCLKSSFAHVTHTSWTTRRHTLTGTLTP